MTVYDPTLCAEALRLLKHDAVALTAEHLDQLAVIGGAAMVDRARDARKALLLAAVASPLVTKSAPKSTAVAPGKRRRRLDLTGVAAMVGRSMETVVTPLAAEVAELKRRMSALERPRPATIEEKVARVFDDLAVRNAGTFAGSLAGVDEDVAASMRAYVRQHTAALRRDLLEHELPAALDAAASAVLDPSPGHPGTAAVVH